MLNCVSLIQTNVQHDRFSLKRMLSCEGERGILTCNKTLHPTKSHLKTISSITSRSICHSQVTKTGYSQTKLPTMVLSISNDQLNTKFWRDFLALGGDQKNITGPDSKDWRLRTNGRVHLNFFLANGWTLENCLNWIPPDKRVTLCVEFYFLRLYAYATKSTKCRIRHWC